MNILHSGLDSSLGGANENVVEGVSSVLEEGGPKEKAGGVDSSFFSVEGDAKEKAGSFFSVVVEEGPKAKADGVSVFFSVVEGAPKEKAEVLGSSFFSVVVVEGAPKAKEVEGAPKAKGSVFFGSSFFSVVEGTPKENPCGEEKENSSFFVSLPTGPNAKEGANNKHMLY